MGSPRRESRKHREKNFAKEKGSDAVGIRPFFVGKATTIRKTENSGVRFGLQFPCDGEHAARPDAICSGFDHSHGLR